MEQNNALIDYIFRTQGFELIMDPDEKTIKLKDYDQINQELFNEVSELKKHVFNMFIKGEDQSLKRIRMKLMSTRELLQSVDFELTVDFEDYETAIGLDEITEINNLKIEYLDQLVNLIDGFSFETAHNPLLTSAFKSSYTVEELAYFFKLAVEQGIIVLDKNQKTKFFDFIASNFQSKDQKQISPNSIRNKSYDPSPATIERIREDLLQMLQLTSAHRYSDKIEWKK